MFDKFKKDYYRILTKDLTELLEYAGFKPEQAKEEATKLSKLDWTFEEMLADYRALANLEAIAGAETETNAGGFNPNWTVRTELGIAIIREERYKVRRELDKRRDEEIRAERKMLEVRNRGRLSNG